MGKRIVWWAAGFPLYFVLVYGSSASARVQDYQVRRLILFKSGCVIDTLDDRSPVNGVPLRYTATCENTTFYPDGIEIRCDDRDDERSCRILTSERRFESLDMMSRPK